MYIPHFGRPCYPSVWFSVPMPHLRENEEWGTMLKNVAQARFVCLCLHIHRHPLGNLALHFYGENLNKFDELCIFS